MFIAEYVGKCRSAIFGKVWDVFHMDSKSLRLVQHRCVSCGLFAWHEVWHIARSASTFSDFVWFNGSEPSFCQRLESQTIAFMF